MDFLGNQINTILWNSDFEQWWEHREKGMLISRGFQEEFKPGLEENGIQTDRGVGQKTSRL